VPAYASAPYNRCDGVRRRIGATAAILAAGGIAYFASAAGEAGPFVVFGRGDANRAAPDAWLQIPVHVALAAGVAVAGPAGATSVAWLASVIGGLFLGLWAAALVILGLTSLADYADLLDVIVSAALLALYFGALLLLWPDRRWAAYRENPEGET
jgi:hypothetical protein